MTLINVDPLFDDLRGDAFRSAGAEDCWRKTVKIGTLFAEWKLGLAQ